MKIPLIALLLLCSIPSNSVAQDAVDRSLPGLGSYSGGDVLDAVSDIRFELTGNNTPFRRLSIDDSGRIIAFRWYYNLPYGGEIYFPEQEKWGSVQDLHPAAKSFIGKSSNVEQVGPGASFIGFREYLTRAFVAKERILRIETASNSATNFSSNGRFFFSTDQRMGRLAAREQKVVHQLRVTDLQTGQTVKGELPVDASISNREFAYSPESKTLYTSLDRPSGSGLFEIAAAGHNGPGKSGFSVKRIGESKAAPNRLHLRNADQKLVVIDSDTLIILDAENGNEETRCNLIGAIHSVSPNGKWVASSTGTSLFLTRLMPPFESYNLAFKERQAGIALQAQPVWSPDSARLACIMNCELLGHNYAQFLAWRIPQRR